MLYKNKLYIRHRFILLSFYNRHYKCSMWASLITQHISINYNPVPAIVWQHVGIVATVLHLNSSKLISSSSSDSNIWSFSYPHKEISQGISFSAVASTIPQPESCGLACFIHYWWTHHSAILAHHEENEREFHLVAKWSLVDHSAAEERASSGSYQNMKCLQSFSMQKLPINFD